MVTDFFIMLFYEFFMAIVGGSEPLRFQVDSSVYDACMNFISFVFYILPVDGLKPIVFIISSIIVFRSLVSLIKTIWDLLPIL